MKVTAKNINSLPEGMHRVDRCLYVRQREGKRPTFYFVYTILGKRKELPSVRCQSSRSLRPAQRPLSTIIY